MARPRIRGDDRPRWPYPITEIPREQIINVGHQLMRHFFINDGLEGNKWADLFADAVDGEHLGSPLGHVDVVAGTRAWSVKTVKASSNSHTQNVVRIISGRNSPRYSQGMESLSDERRQEIGNAVLEIWNTRVNLSLGHYPIGYRIIILIRDNNNRYTLFELGYKTYEPADYEWVVNDQKNFEGRDIRTGDHKFTWQPHGSQFTILYGVPDYATKFELKQTKIKPQIIDDLFQFDQSWVTFVNDT